MAVCLNEDPPSKRIHAQICAWIQFITFPGALSVPSVSMRHDLRKIRRRCEAGNYLTLDYWVISQQKIALTLFLDRLGDRSPNLKHCSAIFYCCATKVVECIIYEKLRLIYCRYVLVLVIKTYSGINIMIKLMSIITMSNTC